MQDASDFDFWPFDPINHEMRAGWMNPHRRSQFSSFTGHLGKIGKKIEDSEQTICIAICLFDTPARGAVSPDFRKIGLRGWPKNPAVATWHAARASGP